MVGRQLPLFSLIVPFWVVWAFAGWRGMKDVWPAILVTGLSFAIPQFVISNFINPWIVDIGASLISMGCLILFLKIWQPKQLWLSPALRGKDEFGCDDAGGTGHGQDIAEPGGALERAAAVDHRLHRDADLGQRQRSRPGRTRSLPGITPFPICTT